MGPRVHTQAQGSLQAHLVGSGSVEPGVVTAGSPKTSLRSYFVMAELHSIHHLKFMSRPALKAVAEQAPLQYS